VQTEELDDLKAGGELKETLAKTDALLQRAQAGCTSAKAKLNSVGTTSIHLELIQVLLHDLAASKGRLTRFSLEWCQTFFLPSHVM